MTHPTTTIQSRVNINNTPNLCSVDRKGVHFIINMVVRPYFVEGRKALMVKKLARALFVAFFVFLIYFRWLSPPTHSFEPLLLPLLRFVCAPEIPPFNEANLN